MHETIVHLSNDFSLHTSAENYLVVFFYFFGIDDCNVFFYCFSSITTISCVTNSSSRVIEQINEMLTKKGWDSSEVALLIQKPRVRFLTLLRNALFLLLQRFIDGT